jgi:glycosyltransferase involved in cell wall biosynthesis
MTPLRTTVVSPFGVLGGAEYWLLRLLDATDELVVSAVLLRDGPLRAELEQRGIDVQVTDVGRRPQDLVLAWPELGRTLRRHRPDVVVGNGVKAQAALGPVPRGLRVPSVWVKHDHSFDRRLTPALARMATSVIATTEDLVAPTGRDDVVVLHPARPVEPPLPVEQATAELSALAGTRAPRLLLMLSRLTRYKGVDTAIEAVALADEDWHLMVLGDEDPAEPTERQRLLDLAAALGIAARVHLVGHVDGASRLLPGADALAVLTRPDGPRTPGKEGFGMSAMEAMLAGVPVIAPDDGGPVARRTAQGAGVLVDATDPKAVAAALTELTPERRAAMGSVARRQAESTFLPASTAARTFVDVLRQAAERHGPAGRARGPRR